MRRSLLAGIPLVLALSACGEPRVKAGAPIAGAAEATLDLPLGTPMAGYTARAKLFTGFSRPDARTSPFTVGFVPSAGIHTRPTVKVLWLHNDDHHAVIVKADLCYMADHVVADVEAALSEALDQDLTGQVLITTSHSHQSWGTFDAHRTYFLGGDRYHPENDARLVDTITTTALQAWEGREPVAIGAGWARDWDPDDLVYRDRRGINNDLAIWGTPGEATGKDPWLHVLRVDRLDGSPMAVTTTFGIHGIAVGEDSAMISTEASGGVELAVQESFDTEVVVMHLQGAGGDASPAGRGGRFDKLEDIGRKAVGPIRALIDAVETSTEPIEVETVATHAPQSLEAITVSRDGAVDWRYAPPTRDPDEVVYNEDGSVASPIDEFNQPGGAAFCGEETAMIPGGGIGAQVYPYESCTAADVMVGLIERVFELPEGEVSAPMPEATRARLGALRLGPLRTLQDDGTVTDEGAFATFLPGEPTATLAEQLRRTADDIGPGRPWLVGYAQDHEGYLLLAEDWLAGGYEPTINQWGPLQGEYLLEQIVQRSRTELGDGHHQEPALLPPPEGAWDRSLVPTGVPERAPDAGTRLDAAPEPPLWTPDDLPVDLAIPAEVPRVQGQVQLAWVGGDPRVDTPRVVLQRDEGGTWVEVTRPSGRPVTDDGAEILLAWTPDPLRAEDGPRTHRWWAVWQAVPTAGAPAALPEGTYRLAVTGQTWTGDEELWPWTTSPYEVASEPFAIVPAALSLTPDLEADVLAVTLDGPAHGFRWIGGQDAQGPNPVQGPLEVVVDGISTEVEPTLDGAGRSVVPLPADWSTLEVIDAWGNRGTLGGE